MSPLLAAAIAFLAIICVGATLVLIYDVGSEKGWWPE